VAGVTTHPVVGSPITPDPLVANASSVSGSPTAGSTQPALGAGSVAANPSGASGAPGGTGIGDELGTRSASFLNPAAVTDSPTAGPAASPTGVGTSGVNPVGTSVSPASGSSSAILSDGGRNVNPIGQSGPPGGAGAVAPAGQADRVAAGLNTFAVSDAPGSRVSQRSHHAGHRETSRARRTPRSQ
jgi:hypothetical protein